MKSYAAVVTSKFLGNFANALRPGIYANDEQGTTLRILIV